jgi:dynein light intermediate chain 1, cytosolic
LKHNVIDRDKVVVPPNWDSWGKIRVLRDGFDVERMSQGWTSDIEEEPVYTNRNTVEGDQSGLRKSSQAPEGLPSAVSAYEEAIRDPRGDVASNLHGDSTGRKLEIKSQDTQAFLAAQLEALDRIRSTGELGRESSTKLKSHTETEAGEENNVAIESRVNEHIGPIQFNMGGIQVDADDMLKRLKVRVTRTPNEGDICIMILISLGPTKQPGPGH